jgi:hypothetical protein
VTLGSISLPETPELSSEMMKSGERRSQGLRRFDETLTSSGQAGLSSAFRKL